MADNTRSYPRCGVNGRFRRERTFAAFTGIGNTCLAFLGAGPERDGGHGTGGRRRRTLSEGNRGQAWGLWGFERGGWFDFEAAIAVTGYARAGEGGAGAT